MENIMFCSASFQSIVIYRPQDPADPHQRNLMPMSLCAEPWAARVCKYCLSTSAVCPASPSCLLRKGAVVLSVDAIVQVMPLQCLSAGAILQSHVVLKGKEMGKLCGWCGLVRIFFLFLLRRQLAGSSSAPYRDGCAPFSPLPAGMGMSIFCGAAPYHRQNQCHEVVSFPWNSHQTWHTVACGFSCISEGNGADPLPWSLGCLASTFLELQKCWALSWQPSHVPGPMCSDSRVLSCSL